MKSQENFLKTLRLIGKPIDYPEFYLKEERAKLFIDASSDQNYFMDYSNLPASLKTIDNINLSRPMSTNNNSSKTRSTNISRPMSTKSSAHINLISPNNFTPIKSIGRLSTSFLTSPKSLLKSKSKIEIQHTTPKSTPSPIIQFPASMIKAIKRTRSTIPKVFFEEEKKVRIGNVLNAKKIQTYVNCGLKGDDTEFRAISRIIGESKGLSKSLGKYSYKKVKPLVDNDVDIGLICDSVFELDGKKLNGINKKVALKKKLKKDLDERFNPIVKSQEFFFINRKNIDTFHKFHEIPICDYIKENSDQAFQEIISSSDKSKFAKSEIIFQNDKKLSKIIKLFHNYK